jgi:hypothetical protein
MGAVQYMVVCRGGAELASTRAILDQRMAVKDIPYFSQWESPEIIPDILSGKMTSDEDPRWKWSGADVVDEYTFWVSRICGMACLRMILAYRGLEVPPSIVLAKSCMAEGGYIRRGDRVDGLIYAPFVKWIRAEFGINAEVHGRLDVRDMGDIVKGGGIVMASAHNHIRWPDRVPPSRGGHLILAIGSEGDDLIFHDPSGLPNINQSRARISYEQFEPFYGRRGIVFYD